MRARGRDTPGSREKLRVAWASNEGAAHETSERQLSESSETSPEPPEPARPVDAGPIRAPPEQFGESDGRAGACKCTGGM